MGKLESSASTAKDHWPPQAFWHSVKLLLSMNTRACRTLPMTSIYIQELFNKTEYSDWKVIPPASASVAEINVPASWYAVLIDRSKSNANELRVLATWIVDAKVREFMSVTRSCRYNAHRDVIINLQDRRATLQFLLIILIDHYWSLDDSSGRKLMQHFLLPLLSPS